jgi:hypothetical protein
VRKNQALGGAGGAGANGGDGLGGGIASGALDFALGQPDPTSSLTVNGGKIAGNEAVGGTGGSGANGGDGLGGGSFLGGGTADFDHSQVVFNDALGGAAGSGGTAGQGVGGGLYIFVDASVFLSPDTLVTGNHASTSNNNIFGSFTVG